MNFMQRHPYLFWQLIGWGIMAADAVFFVISALNDFGEWCYPIIVFSFIAALFAVAASPIILHFSRQKVVPQNEFADAEKVIRSKISLIQYARKIGHPALAAFLGFFSIIFFIFAAYILGEYVHLALGFASIVLALAVPFVIWFSYSAAMTRKFFAVKNGEKLVDLYHPENIKELYAENSRALVYSGELASVLLNFFYNWLRYYLKTERLELYRIPAPDLCRDFTPASFLGYDDILLFIPEEQLDLTKEKGELFQKECDFIMGAFPFRVLVSVENSFADIADL